MTARKLQLCQELNNIQQRDISIDNYTLKIKELCDALRSINVNIDDNEMVQICLSGLTPRFGAIRSVVLARENPLSFFDLQSMVLVEENHVRTRIKVEEEDKVVEEEVDSVKADTTKSNPENTTTTTGKALQTRKAEHLVEGEAIMPNQADKTILSSAGIVANSDTTR